MSQLREVRGEAFRAGIFVTLIMVFMVVAGFSAASEAYGWATLGALMAVLMAFGFFATYPFIESIEVERRDGESMEEAFERALEQRGPGHVVVKKVEDEEVEEMVKDDDDDT